MYSLTRIYEGKNNNLEMATEPKDQFPSIGKCTGYLNNGLWVLA